MDIFLFFMCLLQVKLHLENLSLALSRIAYSKPAIERFVEAVRAHCSSHNRSAKETLRLVVDIIDRIRGRPDDIQARKLRVLNATIWVSRT